MATALSSPYVVSLVAAVVIAVCVGVVTWRQRPAPGATALCALVGTVVVWSGTYAVGLTTTGQAARLFWLRVMWLGVALAPVTWLWFALSYTGYQQFVTVRSFAVALVVPLATLVAVWTNPSHHLFWRTNGVTPVDGVVTTVQTFGPGFWVFAVYGYALVLTGSLLLVRRVVTADAIYADQGVALVVGGVVPLVANALSVIGISVLPGFDLTPYAMTTSGVAFGYALVRYDLFEFVPATKHLGRDALVDTMQEGVVIVDVDDRVVEVNPNASRAFDCDPSAVVGDPVSGLLGSDVSIPDPGERRELTGARGARTYEMTASPVTDWQSRHVGTILLFRDVTERTFREQRLSVLNRVLRHNLRNHLTVVTAHAESLVDALSAPEVEHAETIDEKTTELADLTEKARTIDSVMARADEPVTVDLTAIVADVRESFREHDPAVTFDTDLPGSLPVTSMHPGLVETLVRNLVENAVEHNDDPEPVVEIRGREVQGTPTMTEFTVADDGPPIPEHELAVLESGDETALQHGSGLGLWLVNWSVRRLGGSVAFETGADGNVVTVRLPVPPADVVGGDTAPQ
jgi:signal transduction histidine kinase